MEKWECKPPVRSPPPQSEPLSHGEGTCRQLRGERPCLPSHKFWRWPRAKWSMAFFHICVLIWVLILLWVFPWIILSCKYCVVFVLYLRICLCKVSSECRICGHLEPNSCAAMTCVVSVPYIAMRVSFCLDFLSEIFHEIHLSYTFQVGKCFYCCHF